MKKFYLLLCFFILNSAFAQKENNHWFLYGQNQLDFNQNPPTTNQVQNPYSGYYNTSSISTETGELIFYTDGYKVFDKNGNIMPNGDGIMETTDIRSTVIVPKPGSCTEYYVISSAFFCYPDSHPDYDPTVPHPQCNLELNDMKGIRYSIINLDDNGDGKYKHQTETGYVDSSQKGILIPGPVGNTAVTVVRHTNGQDYWLIAGDTATDKFHVFEITNSGINPSIGNYEQSVGNNLRIGYFSDLVSNQQGNKLAVMTYATNLQVGASNFSFPFLIDFDNATGQLSNPNFISDNPFMPGCNTCPYAADIYAFEFSPDGSQLYFTNVLGLVQMQVLPNLEYPEVIMNSFDDPNNFREFFDLKLSPENPSRILLSSYNPQNNSIYPISAINNPNIGGNVNLEFDAITFPYNWYFPKFVEGGGVWPKDLDCYYEDSPCDELDFKPFKKAVPDLFSQTVEEIVTELAVNIPLNAKNFDKEFGDFDNDGDIDILFVNESMQLKVMVNTAGAGVMPEFSTSNSIGIDLDYSPFMTEDSFPIYPISTRLYDWDDDGDQDLVVLSIQEGSFGAIGGLFLFYNDGNGNFSSPKLLLDARDEGASPYGFSTTNDFPADINQFLEVGDLNNDGKIDLIISGSEKIKGTVYFENVGNNINPSYTMPSPQQWVTDPNTSPYSTTGWIENVFIPRDYTNYPIPELFSTDCIEKQDLFIAQGNWNEGGGLLRSNRVYFHENTGNLSNGTFPEVDLTGIHNLFGFQDDFNTSYPNPDFPDATLPPLFGHFAVIRFVDFLGNGCPIAIAITDNKEFIYYEQDCDLMSVSNVESELGEEKSILLYPNPATNEVNFYVKDQLTIYGIQIYDMTGKLVSQPKVSNQKINTAQLNPGIYFVNFETDKGTISEKLIIK